MKTTKFASNVGITSLAFHFLPLLLDLDLVALVAVALGSGDAPLERDLALFDGASDLLLFLAEERVGASTTVSFLERVVFLALPPETDWYMT